jgi:FkbM family methyltransferase
VTLVRDRASGLLYRRSAHDKVILDEVRGVYSAMPVRPSDVLLDLGAHIGATTRLVLAKGAARSFAVEADPATIPVLRRNVRAMPVEVMWGAVGPATGRTKFYARPDRPHLSSTLEERGRIAVTVPMFALDDLLTASGATIVKCDIEFGEYALPRLRDLPPRVRVLAMEVHIRYAGIFDHRSQTPDELTAQRRAAADLIAAVEAQGFREVRRKDKLAKPGQAEAREDDTGLPSMCKAVDAIWER